jgi:hypothetical protein
MLLVVVLVVVWIVLLPLATVVGLYVVAPRLRQARSDYRPRRLSTYGMVLKRIRRSSHNDQLAP